MTLTLIVLAVAAVVVVLGTWATACAMIRSDVFSDRRQPVHLAHRSTQHPRSS